MKYEEFRENRRRDRKKEARVVFIQIANFKEGRRKESWVLAAK